MADFFHDIVIDGRPAVLCLASIDWSTRPKITHSFDTIEAEGNTGIEALEPQRLVMRLSVEYRYTFDPDVAQAFLDEIRDLQGSRIALPLAPDILEAATYATERIYAAQQWVNFDPVSGNYALNAAGGHAYSAGLLVGRLAEQPRITARTDIHGTVLVRLAHDAPWSCRIEPNTLAMAAWTLDPDWAVKLPEDTWVTRLRRRSIGNAGEAALEFKDSPAKRVQRAGFTLENRETIRKVLTFFSEKRGASIAFSVPQSFRPGWDLVDGNEPYLQARFAGDDLVLQYGSQDDARAQLAFQQSLLLGGGAPAQDRPPRARLYKFWWDGSATLKTYTDWEQPLVHSAVTYEPKTIEHKAEAETLRVGTADWEIMLEDFEGNPLRAFSLLSLERRLRVEIWECDPANAAGAVLIFAGEISKAPSTGRIYRATAVLLGGALQRMVPGFYCQQNCNHTVYDELCGVDSEAHKVAGTLAVKADTVLDTTCAAAQAADYFALGYIQVNTGDLIELRFILRSEPIAGGQRLTVHRPLVTSAVNDAVEFFPGCDSQYSGGCAKFGNQDDFGGAPHKPAFIESVSTGFKTKVGK